MSIVRVPFVKFISLILITLFPCAAMGDVVTVPFGTRVFIELDQQVTSKKKHNQSGSFVRAHVWRDVVVEGRTVAKAGTPVMVKIGHIKPAKVAGIKGKVELEALQVTAIDGADLMLTGGYDQSGKSLTALSVTLAVVVFVPLIFIKGKQAKLAPGTIFDAMVAQPTDIDIPDSPSRTVKLRVAKTLDVTVLYGILEQEGDKKVKTLPLQIQMDGKTFSSAKITQVNDVQIKPLTLDLGDVEKVGESQYVASATVDLKALGKNFTRGFNQFTVDVDGETDEVMLDLEL